MLINALFSELFGGEKRFALLRAIFLNPASRRNATELAELAGSNPGNVARWLKRWVEVGLVERLEAGRDITYRAAGNPLLAGLTIIAKGSDEILDDIKEALPEEVEAAAIFGSVARGEEKAESDVDVLVLGEGLSSIRVNAALKPAGRKHRREIHATVCSRSEFEQMLSEENSFALGVVRQPTIPLKGEFAYGDPEAVATGN